MKILFIGGTGIISSGVSELATQKGMDLYLLNRGNRNSDVPKGSKVIIGDIRNPENINLLLKNYKFDVIVNWISFNKEHVHADYNMFKDKTRQYIFISSTATYQKPPTHYLVNESTPLYNPYWNYAQDKIKSEDYLIQKFRNDGFPVTIVRPSYTYNKTTIPFIFNSRPHRWTIVDRMKKGEKIIVPGDGTSLFSITHNSDFAKGFIGLLGNMQTIGHAFHITTDEVMTWDQFLYCIGDASGYKPNIIHIPSDFISKFSPENAGGLIGDKSVSSVFDNSKIKRFVPEFKATLSFREGIQQSIDWYKKNPELCSVDENFNLLCDKIIMAYEKGFNNLY